MKKKLTIYHNPECSKCRGTVCLVEEANASFETIEYLKKPPTVAELDRLLVMLGMEPQQIVRTREDEYTELKLDTNPPRSRQEWLEVLVKNPILIERPIITDGTRAVIGRPPENVKKLLG